MQIPSYTKFLFIDMLIALKNVYLNAANSQYVIKQYTYMILQLYMLLTSNVLLLNAVLLDNGLPKDLQGGVLYTIIF